MGVRDQHHAVVKYLQLPESAWPALARLSGLQVGIWADAWTWQQQGQRAFRTNEQLAQMFGCNERSIRRALNQLTEMGFVEVKRAGQMRFIVAKADQSVHQVYHSRSISKSPSKSMRVRAELEGVNEGLHFPWTSDAFMEAWKAYKDYMRVEHRFGFKSEHTEQLALVKLTKQFNDEHSAITAIGQAMASGWKSIQAPKARFGNGGAPAADSPAGDAEAIARRDF